MLVQCWFTVSDGGPTLIQHWVKIPVNCGRSYYYVQYWEMAIFLIYTLIDIISVLYLITLRDSFSTSDLMKRCNASQRFITRRLMKFNNNLLPVRKGLILFKPIAQLSDDTDPLSGHTLHPRVGYH